MSVDSPFSHKVWNETELSKMVDGGIPFPMLSDRGGKIGTLYGVYDETGGVDIRGRFLIDPDGIIQAAEILAPPVGRNPAELKRQIKAFQVWCVKLIGAVQRCQLSAPDGNREAQP